MLCNVYACIVTVYLRILSDHASCSVLEHSVTYVHVCVGLYKCM